MDKTREWNMDLLKSAARKKLGSDIEPEPVSMKIWPLPEPDDVELDPKPYEIAPPNYKYTLRERFQLWLQQRRNKKHLREQVKRNKSILASAYTKPDADIHLNPFRLQDKNAG